MLWNMVWMPLHFNKFEKVFSGHYHCRSDQETVHYLGNPYEMFWNDVNDTERGFHIFDTETLEHTPINNPYRFIISIIMIILIINYLMLEN